ncbi:LPD5 domain-containing protein [Cereibacter sphaeroides]|uniref:LPD5 domain-containing protein n=1 Tax=Cereibacter sphaeroides TaxID=1063 RepID=UPI001F2E64F5|nr:LPD5 domain-containing protein [Cereibacter sphaeroides]MCE6959315.1 LPD5 domain-containing protein [Cereibacter sphaeroides]MCE6972907.1 LPD5 domain-containing protein [Cereibacter sphaeroides]
MARIDDFGRKIDGAAKDRRRRHAERLGTLAEAEVILEPLSRSFPEPDWLGLIDDGLETAAADLLRAVRDDFLPKPHAGLLPAWARSVMLARDTCRDLLEGRIDLATARSRLFPEAGIIFLDASNRTEALYAAFGHEQSLKKFRLRHRPLKRLGGVAFPQPRAHWILYGVEGAKEKVLAVHVDQASVRRKLRELIEKDAAGPRTAKGPKFQIYWYKADPQTFFLGVRNGKSWIDLERFPGKAAAQAYLREHPDRLLEKYRRLRETQAERRAENEPRHGIEWRQGRDITMEEFHETFRFRGVQFGNYVENGRRQKDLNDAWDALHDLAAVLGWTPSALSLDGRLALAFGARGKGGTRAAAAHFEPSETVINLTKTRGSGSIAHEWFHALDNHVARASGRHLDFATETAPDAAPPADRDAAAGLRAFRELSERLARTGIPERSRRMDATRSSPYWATPVEMAARAFEAWVIDRLAGAGHSNDWLANVETEEVFEAEAALLGHRPGRYPYPKQGELEAVGIAFDRLFAREGALVRLVDDDPAIQPFRIQGVPRPAAGPAQPARDDVLQVDEPEFSQPAEAGPRRAATPPAAIDRALPPDDDLDMLIPPGEDDEEDAGPDRPATATRPETAARGPAPLPTLPEHVRDGRHATTGVPVPAPQTLPTRPGIPPRAPSAPPQRPASPAGPLRPTQPRPIRPAEIDPLQADGDIDWDL